MTKKERAIIMAYTGGVTFKEDDIGYFLEYVKEKTGLELNVIDWSSEGTPVIDFGPESDKAVDKIRKACKKDFDDLINSSSEGEPEKSEEENTKIFFDKLKELDRLLGRKLLPDEVFLLAAFDSIELKGNIEKEEVHYTKYPQTERLREKDEPISKKEIDDYIEVCRLMTVYLGRKFTPHEGNFMALYKTIEQNKEMFAGLKGEDKIVVKLLIRSLVPTEE